MIGIDSVAPTALLPLATSPSASFSFAAYSGSIARKFSFLFTFLVGLGLPNNNH